MKKSTYFDRKELQQWYKGFLRDCPNGQLTKSEFVKIYKQYFPFGDPTDFSNYSFNAFDSDKNGYIEFNEFIIGLSITSRGTIEEKLVWCFRLYDLDGDGKVSYNEMLAVISSIYKMIGSMVELNEDEATPKLRTDKIFQLMNKKTDEFITMDEFKETSKVDPSIINALNLYDGLV